MKAIQFGFAVILLTACARSPLPSEMTGKYFVNHQGIENTLMLQADGRYEHTIQMPEGPEESYKGRWKTMDDESPSLRIEFSNFYFPRPAWESAEPELETKTRIGYAYPLAIKRWGKITICFGDGPDDCFSKR